ncbi:hypothetical protein [Xylophilus ampelinus]|nr:hypothetical protein [Xylophilus ampelinus]MCS4511215.1 hypothetical protein [Xylophilus ampelinus]
MGGRRLWLMRLRRCDGATEADNRNSPAVPGMSPGARRALPCRPTGGAS